MRIINITSTNKFGIAWMVSLIVALASWFLHFQTVASIAISINFMISLFMAIAAISMGSEKPLKGNVEAVIKLKPFANSLEFTNEKMESRLIEMTEEEIKALSSLIDKGQIKKGSWGPILSEK